jgi:hypothetical protein
MEIFCDWAAAAALFYLAFVLELRSGGETPPGQPAGRRRYLTTPSSGELAVAYNFFGILPER